MLRYHAICSPKLVDIKLKCVYEQTLPFFIYLDGMYLEQNCFKTFVVPLNHVRKNLSKVKRTAYLAFKDFDIRDSKRAFLQLFLMR